MHGEKDPSTDFPLTTIVSGGQTGVDRAALDVAISLKIPHGGWCPRGRKAEDGRIPDRYKLRETDGSAYRIRTEKNVLDSDGTLVLYRSRLQGGTDLTVRFAKQHGKPIMIVKLDGDPDTAQVGRWIRENQVARLNVAGPRESSHPGIAEDVAEFLTAAIQPFLTVSSDNVAGGLRLEASGRDGFA